VLSNGSLYVNKVFVEDTGKYGCMAGNNGGLEREEAYLHVHSGITINCYCNYDKISPCCWLWLGQALYIMNNFGKNVTVYEISWCSFIFHIASLYPCFYHTCRNKKGQFDAFFRVTFLNFHFSMWTCMIVKVALSLKRIWVFLSSRYINFLIIKHLAHISAWQQGSSYCAKRDTSNTCCCQCDLFGPTFLALTLKLLNSLSEYKLTWLTVFADVWSK